MEYTVEEWKRIPGYGGFYNVSNLGRVCSTINGDIRIKKQTKNKDGYLKVRIGFGDISNIVFVHRLVAQLFIGDISNLEVNHIDGNKVNNNVYNLEICTHAENMSHAFNVLKINNKGMLGKFGKDHHLSKPIYQLSKDGQIIKKHNSLMCASRDLNLSASNISKVALGKAHTCGGFKWSYENQEELWS